jgi:hypothetical protein
MTNDQQRHEFFRLIERANLIGALLPERIEDVDLDDPAVTVELKMVLREFNAALAAIETFSSQADEDSWHSGGLSGEPRSKDYCCRFVYVAANVPATEPKHRGAPTKIIAQNASSERCATRPSPTTSPRSQRGAVPVTTSRDPATPIFIQDVERGSRRAK